MRILQTNAVMEMVLKSDSQKGIYNQPRPSKINRYPTITFI